MSAYSKTKSISKFLIYFSFVAVLLSGGAFFVAKSQIGADTNSPTERDFGFIIDNGLRGLQANNITSYEVINADYSTYKDLDKCALGDNCFIFWNEKVWQDPSIEFNDGQYKPAWAFLLEMRNRIAASGTDSDKNNIKTLMANYVADAFNRNFKKNFDISSVTSGNIIIPYQEYFDALDNAGIAASDPYMEFYEQNGRKTAKMRLEPSYPKASENSAWLAGANFAINSMLKPYKEAGFDTSQYENAIREAIKNYMFAATKEDSKDALSFKYPARVLLTKTSDQNFEYNIDVDKFKQPESGYKTKIYIKPASKKDDAAHILFGPFAESSYQFSWQEATSSGYVDSNGNKASVSGADYDLNFPQQYFIRVVTYEGEKEKASVITTLDTHTEATINSDSEVSDGNSFLKISAKPSSVKQGESVTATIEAINSTDPNKQISKVVLYACTGSATEVGGNSSATCTYKNDQGESEDAIKAAFSGSNLTFQDNKANLAATWDTSGSAIGNHSLMAKAFTANTTDSYIANSKTAVTIQVTNSNIGLEEGGTGSGGDFSNLLDARFNNQASGNARGSKIKTAKDAANRALTIFMVIIGALSVISIIYGGILYITSGGDQQKAEKGKKVVIYAMLGVVIAVLVLVIENAVIDIANRLIS